MNRNIPEDIAATDLVMAYLEEKAVMSGGIKAIATPASFVTYGDHHQGFTVLIVAKEAPQVLANYTMAIKTVFEGCDSFREHGAGFRHRAISFNIIGNEEALMKTVYSNDPDGARRAEITVRREGRRKAPVLQGITI